MSKPYPIELRERVVRAYETHETWTYEYVAEVFGVGRATVNRWLSRKRKTGSVAARPMGGSVRTAIRDDEMEFIRRVLEELPDSTLMELQGALFEEYGKQVSIPTIWDNVRSRLGFSRKRGLWLPRSGTVQTS